MENLDKALSSLAEQLGIHSEEFLFWLTNGGLASYAKMQVIQNGVIAFITIAITVICIIAIYCAMKKLENSDSYYDPTMIIIFCGVIGTVSGGSSIFYVVDFLTWWLTPEGAIIQMLLTKL